MTQKELLVHLDTLVAGGALIATLTDTGEVGYWTPHQATAQQVRNSLSVEEVRRVRRAMARRTLKLSSS